MNKKVKQRERRPILSKTKQQKSQTTGKTDNFEQNKTTKNIPLTKT
jgi:hypothetical protein